MGKKCTIVLGTPLKPKKKRFKKYTPHSYFYWSIFPWKVTIRRYNTLNTKICKKTLFYWWYFEIQKIFIFFCLYFNKKQQKESPLFLSTKKYRPHFSPLLVKQSKVKTRQPKNVKIVETFYGFSWIMQELKSENHSG